MNSSSALNILALAVLFTALAFSVLFAIRQIVVMRQSNQMPIFVDMLQEWRSSDFQRAERYVMRGLASENNLGEGLAGLGEEGYLAATSVLSFFATVGFLVSYGILSEASAVLILGYRANQLWVNLETLVLSERELQGSNDFAKFLKILLVGFALTRRPRSIIRLSSAKLRHCLPEHAIRSRP